MKIHKARRPPLVWVGSMERGQWFESAEILYVVQTVSEKGVEARHLRTMEEKHFELTDLVYFYEMVTVILQTKIPYEKPAQIVVSGPVVELPRNGANREHRNVKRDQFLGVGRPQHEPNGYCRV